MCKGINMVGNVPLAKIGNVAVAKVGNVVISIDNLYGGSLLIKNGKDDYSIHDVGLTYDYFKSKGLINDGADLSINNAYGVNLNDFVEKVMACINKTGTFLADSKPIRGSNAEIFNFLKMIEGHGVVEDWCFIPNTILALNPKDLSIWF